jgi:hypothetical protein
MPIRATSSFHQHFEAIGMHGDKAWMRNVQNGNVQKGADHLALLSRRRRINGERLAEAAE